MSHSSLRRVRFMTLRGEFNYDAVAGNKVIACFSFFVGITFERAACICLIMDKSRYRRTLFVKPTNIHGFHGQMR